MSENFVSVYEEMVTNIENEEKLDLDLKKMLKEKRDFGLKKYKEASFQLNLKNALEVNIKQHLKEEIIDAFNYANHWKIKNKLENKKEETKIDRIIDRLNEIWVNIKEVDTTR